LAEKSTALLLKLYGVSINGEDYSGFRQPEAMGTSFKWGDSVAFWHDKMRSIQLFQTSPKILRLAVMLYLSFPPSFQDVDDL